MGRAGWGCISVGNRVRPLRMLRLRYVEIRWGGHSARTAGIDTAWKELKKNISQSIASRWKGYTKSRVVEIRFAVAMEMGKHS